MWIPKVVAASLLPAVLALAACGDKIPQVDFDKVSKDLTEVKDKIESLESAREKLSEELTEAQDRVGQLKSEVEEIKAKRDETLALVEILDFFLRTRIAGDTDEVESPASPKDVLDKVSDIRDVELHSKALAAFEAIDTPEEDQMIAAFFLEVMDRIRTLLG